MNTYYQQRTQHLLDQITNLPANALGSRGCWVKATEHSHQFDADYPSNRDQRGRGARWNRVITQYYRDGHILIYKIRNRNWFVLNQHATAFEQTFPEASLKV